ncbi:class I SAM-dependent methyltransferase [Paenibacillus sp. MMS20-IR301]|uniref:class I SAM-dependent methyltransferase n=1 Tax=Paenibacillus sp. MMS20-IR301 TaxID=2895946 RepID=UPI0028F14F99|nr:class I SAM-dependent methyltransferase [Paenibacillus sp. MMS20-IR301]WNS42096.1 class I SAM-dependent methyltransferase [Paenibacillus sp. MMS20-IR301]
MENKDWHKESERFNEAAAIYDLYRPSYPAALIDQIIEAATLTAGSDILEIGAGSGKASELFLDRGYRLLCIEPGPQLAELGRQKHKEKRVRFDVVRFEHWDGPECDFDLIFSAQAFHWVPQPEGYNKCGHLLKAGGKLALFWNFYQQGDSGLEQEIAAVCAEYEVFWFNTIDEIERRVEMTAAELGDSGVFKAPEIYCYPWSSRDNAESFINFLRTSNGFIGLPEVKQQELGSRLHALISSNGGVLQRNYICTLFIAEALGTSPL